MERSYPCVATGVDQRVETVNHSLEEIYRQAIEGRKHAFTELVSLSEESELAASYVSILCFFCNKHIKKDVDYANALAVRALPWLQRSIEDGYAQLNLGMMYAKGIGIHEDLTESTNCLGVQLSVVLRVLNIIWGLRVIKVKVL